MHISIFQGKICIEGFVDLAIAIRLVLYGQWHASGSAESVQLGVPMVASVPILHHAIIYAGLVSYSGAAGLLIEKDEDLIQDMLTTCNMVK